MTNYTFTVAATLGLSVYPPTREEEQKLGNFPACARRIISMLPLPEVGRQLLTSKCWRILGLQVLQNRFNSGVVSFVDELFLQGCSRGALRVARQFMRTPRINENLLRKWVEALPQRNAVSKQFVCELATNCIQADSPEKIPGYVAIASVKNRQIVQDEGLNSVKRQLMQRGDLMPLFLLVASGIELALQEPCKVIRHTQLRSEYAHVSACLLHPKKNEKLARWLQDSNLKPWGMLSSILKVTRQLLQLKEELQVQCDDLIDFLLSIDLNKSEELSEKTFREVLIEETEKHPLFAEFCINRLFETDNYELAKSLFTACPSLSVDQRETLQLKFDIREAEALSVLSHKADREQRAIQDYHNTSAKVAPPPSPSVDEDDELFALLEELDCVEEL